ncbi:hypothetical protein JOM56_001640 [Amanita muscaria]
MASVSEIGLAAVFTQAALFGLYTLTLLHCLRWLLYQDEGWKLRDRTRWLMLVTTLILFAFAVVDLAISIHMSLLILAENSTFLLTDAVLVYRCWVVHSNSWRIILPPIILWLSCLTAFILILFYEFNDFPNSPTARWAEQSKFHTDVAFYVCHIANNIYTTSIVYRILQVVNNTAGGSRRLYKTGRIIAESGILYVVSSLLLLVAYIGASNNNPSFVLVAPIFDAVNYSTSMISFNLVIIRVNQQRAEEDADTLLSSLSKEKPLLESESRSYADEASQNPLHRSGSSEHHEEVDYVSRTRNEVNGTKSQGA